MTTNDYRSELRREFDAEDGSFLIQLRCEGLWDKAAFERLVTAMEACCRDRAGEETLERWVANGFWYLDSIVEHQTKQTGMRLVYEPEYYEQAFAKISDLAYWYFTGESPYA